MQGDNVGLTVTLYKGKGQYHCCAGLELSVTLKPMLSPCRGNDFLVNYVRFRIKLIFGFFAPSALSAFGSDLKYKIHATPYYVRLTPSPSDADIMSGWSNILKIGRQQVICQKIGSSHKSQRAVLCFLA